MKSKTIILITSLLAISLLVTAIAVTKLKENKSTVGPPVGASNQPTPNPNLTEVQGDLVDSFPGLPVYPGARVLSSSKELKEGGNTLYSAVWTISGDNVLSEMVNWYSKQLVSEGWRRISEAGNDELARSVSFTKDSESLILNIVRGDSFSRFRINIQADILIQK